MDLTNREPLLDPSLEVSNFVWSRGFASHILPNGDPKPTFFDNLDQIVDAHQHLKVPRNTQHNDSSVVDLLLGFFEFYGKKFNYKTRLVSLDRKYTSKKSYKFFDTSDPTRLYVVKPTSHSYDLCTNVDDEHLDLFVNECQEGMELLLSNNVDVARTLFESAD